MGAEGGSLVRCSELGCGRLHLPGPKYHHQHRLIYHVNSYYKSAEYGDYLAAQGPAPPSEVVQERLKARLAARRPEQPRRPLSPRHEAPNHSHSSASKKSSKPSSLPSTLKSSSSFKKPNVAKPLSSSTIISALLDKTTQRTPPTSSASSHRGEWRAPSPLMGRPMPPTPPPPPPPPPPSLLVEERGSKSAVERKRSHESDGPRGEEGGTPPAKIARGLRSAEDGTMEALQTLAFAKTGKGQMEVTLATQEGLDDLLSHLSITSALVLRHCALLQLIPAAGRPLIATRTKFAACRYQRRPQTQGRDRRNVQRISDAFNEPALNRVYNGRLAQRVTCSHRMDETLGRFQAGGDRTASNRLQDLVFLALQPSSSNPLPFHHTQAIAENEVKETILAKHPFFRHALDSFHRRKKNQQCQRQRITYVELSPDDYTNTSGH